MKCSHFHLEGSPRLRTPLRNPPHCALCSSDFYWNPAVAFHFPCEASNFSRAKHLDYRRYKPVAFFLAGCWSKVMEKIVIEGILYFNYDLTSSCRVTVRGEPDGLPPQHYSFPVGFYIGSPSSMVSPEFSPSSRMASISVTLNTPLCYIDLEEVG